jgi:hypothetical protein
MNKWFRRTGLAMVLVGALIFLSWFVDPVWEILHLFTRLPMPLQIGSAVAAVGLTVLVLSLLAERWTDREADASLREEEPHRPVSPKP